jgi:hypothetical protein
VALPSGIRAAPADRSWIEWRNGWFAPASAILDFLRESRGSDLRLSWRERARLELLWTFEKLRYGGS